MRNDTPDGGKGPDGGKEPDGTLPLFIGGTDARSKSRGQTFCTMPYEKEEDERSEINWDRLGGEGVLYMHRMARLLTTHS